MTSRPEAETATCEGHGHADANHDHSHADQHGTVVTDPVCGMKVDTRTAKHRFELGGTRYYFCSEHCLEKFKTDPDRYLNPAEHDPAVTTPAMGALPQAAEGTIWTCPMHPEIRRDAACSARRHHSAMRSSMRSPC